MTDRHVVRVVTIALALSVIGALVGSIILATMDKAMPGDAADIGKIALGALGALLARTSSEEPPANVN